MKRTSYSRFLARAAMTLLAAFFSFTGARAQETLTVYEGTTTNYYVPAYIFYFDDFTRSQFVIPADDLADMEGGTITSIKFYTTSSNVPYTTVSSADVYLKEVDYTTMTGLEPKTDDDIVYHGYFDVVTEGEGGSLTITFDTPYTYHGGNLLIGIENTEDVDYKSIYFYGTTVEGASWGGSNGSSLESVTGSQRSFIPKTTFEYTPGSGVFVPKPTTFTVSDITDCSAELAWTGGTGTYNLELKEGDEEFTPLASGITATSFTLDNLAAYTDYSVRIQSVDGENVSGWKTVSFTTEMCSLEDQCTITLDLTDSDGDGWNGAYIEIVDVETGASLGTFTNQNVSKKAVEAKEKKAKFAEAKAADTKAEGTRAAETETYTFAVCKDREIQFVWHSGSYDGECSFVIYDVNDDVIVSGTASVLPYNHTVDCTTTDYKKPTNLAAEVAPRSAVLSWTENSLCTVNDWVLAYKANSEEEFTEVTVSQNPYTLEGLVPETQYTFKVRPVATDGAIKWSDEYSFTTLVAAPVPTALAVSDITTTSAHVSWTGIGESYDLRYVANPNYVFQGYVTNPGAMDGGADASWIQGSQSTWGPNVNYANDYMLADDFTVYTATTLHEIEVYGYQTGSTTTSTFTGLRVQIYDGNPAEGGEVIWGDMDTNIMTATSFTNCYRGSNGETSAMTRPIMAITASGLDIELEPGTYWLVYSLEGTGSSGPWGVPYAEPTVGNTGEGLQHTSSGWIALTDDAPYGCAMKLTFEDLESLDWSYVNNIEGGEYDLTSLNPETTYLVQVRANYSDEGPSKWISTTFTTLPTCMVPTNLAVSNIDKRSADLTWTSNGEEGTWQICINGDEDNLIEVTENPYTLTDLEPETTYTVKVRAYCDEDDQSAWSSPITFTTLVACPAPTNMTFTDITAYSANVSWDGEADSYEMEYAIGGSITYDFENGDLQGWTNLLVNAEGGEWLHSNDNGGGYDYYTTLAHGGTGFAMCYSFIDNDGAYDTNAYLVSPTSYSVSTGASLNFWYDMANDAYPEYFEVCVATVANPTAADFTPIWTLSTKGNKGNNVLRQATQTRQRNTKYENWREVTIDLSAYEGQTIWIAFRDVNYDAYEVWIDDITVNTGSELTWTPVETVTNPYLFENLDPETTYMVRVRANYGGEGYSTWLQGWFTTLENGEIELVNDDYEAATKNSDIIAANIGKTRNVTLSGRTLFKDGLWNTICLPFDVVLEGSPLEGAIAKTLTDASTSPSALYDMHINLIFGDAVTTLEAGKPYIIRWNAANENIVDPVFENVLIEDVPESDRTISMANGNVKFIGYYDAFGINETNEDIFYMKTGKDKNENDITTLVRTNSERILKSCRAYFQFSEYDVDKLKFTIDFGDGSTTGIVDLDREATTNSGWYTVDGKKLDKQPTRKGVYIQNGRAVVIK